MNTSRKYSFGIAVLLLVGMFCFGKYYMDIFTSEIREYSERDTRILQSYNNEVVGKLQDCENASSWQEIVDSYNDIIIHIEDSNGYIMAKTTGREWSLFDVKIQKAFKFGDDAYLIRTSVYLDRDSMTDSNYLFRALIFVLTVVLVAMVAVALIIYTLMLRPVYRLYDNIERYEKGEEAKRTKHRSEIGKLQNRFVDMTETINKQQQNQRRIIASISHDIKTPLTSIMGYAELLKKENLSEERKQRYLETVYGKSMDIKVLIDDFDEYLSYDMGSTIRKERVTVGEMTEMITSFYSDELQHEGVKLFCRCENKKDTIEIDTQKMRRVYGNIFGNSVKHFTGEEKRIEVSCLRDEGYEKIVISDSGEGVEREKLDMIFEPLYTSDQGRKVAGLGLAICKEIIEAHGGMIYAEKSRLGGLAIVIKLKLVM